MKVSVIVPAKNVEKYLGQAVDSILETKYSDLEILIIDDASEDNTVEVAKKIKEEHSYYVKLFKTPGRKSAGAAEARNIGIRNANGQAISFLDADDLYYPERFDHSIEMLRENETVDAVYEPTVVCYEDTADPEELWNIKEMMIEENDEKDLTASLLTSTWGTGAITIRKDFFSRCGLFDKRLRLAEDGELWLRMSYVGHLVKGGDKPVAIYRRHDSNRCRKETFHVADIKRCSHAVKWAKKHQFEDKDKKIKEIEKYLYDTTYGRIDLHIRNQRYDYGAKLLVHLGISYPSAMRSWRYWGNMRNIVNMKYFGFNRLRGKQDDKSVS